jgi:hypothetical protein
MKLALPKLPPPICLVKANSSQYTSHGRRFSVYLILEAGLGAALAPLLTALRLPLRPAGARGSKLCMPAGLETPAGRVAVLEGLQHARAAVESYCHGLRKALVSHLLTALNYTNAAVG